MEFISFLVGLFVGILSIKTYKQIVRMRVKERKENEKRIYNLVESSRDIIYYYQVKPERKFKYISPSIDKVLGEGIVGESLMNPNIPFDLVHPDDYEIVSNKIYGHADYSKPIIQRWRNKEGEYIYFEEYATPIYKNGEFVAIQGIIRNIDDKIKLQKDLEFRISHDTLTGIYNRSYFDQQMERLNKQRDVPSSIILCDLDELKVFNDQYGHKTGDILIKETARILDQFSDEHVFVSRIGGDEFAILIEDQPESYVQAFIKKIHQELTVFNEKSTTINIKASIGYAHAEHSLGNMSSLFVEADSNMYAEKKKRKEMVDTPPILE
ncbi:diguanylate cyclase domain-containing protein [Bacillus salitolerans]|uniref:Diguanylate cyclase domain-containing protein n=1 Tax=Bacillus salitolerans TaxID=1437434 RepID=A0ABW4LZQ6_9BACI